MLNVLHNPKTTHKSKTYQILTQNNLRSKSLLKSAVMVYVYEMDSRNLEFSRNFVGPCELRACKAHKTV